jgi:predicted permease
LTDLVREIKGAVRWLASSPSVTVTAVVCLALGIGANVTMFGVVDTLLFRPPLHVRDADRIVRVYVTHAFPGQPTYTASLTSFPHFRALEDASAAFSSVAAYVDVEATLGQGIGARQIQASLATASMFDLLGVRAVVGRFFSSAEDRAPGDARVAVLSYELWDRQFGSDPGMVGRTLWIADGPYTVIGVAPRGFTGADLTTVDVWLPIRASLEALKGVAQLNSSGSALVSVVARLRPGTTSAQASFDATAALRARVAGSQGTRADLAATLGPIQRERGPDRSDNARISVWAAALCALVLLIACANVANLLFARSVGRRREMAIRHALGAGRGRLVRQMLIESAVLAAFSGLLSFPVAAWTEALVRAYLLPNVASGPIVASARSAVFTVVIALAAGLMAGVMPALQATWPDLTAFLKTGVPQGSFRLGGTRFALVAGQVALTLVLLASAGLFTTSLRNARAADLGVDTRGILAASADLEAAGYKAPAIDALFEQVLDRLRQAPGVERATVAVSLPFRSSMSIAYSIPGSVARPPGLQEVPYVNAVTPAFFATLRMTLRSGRVFNDEDRTGGQPVAVVNETMAHAFWPTEDPLRGCIRPLSETQPCFQVVGVVADARRMFLREVPTPQWYVPLAQSPLPFLRRVLLVRTSVDPIKVVSLVRAAFRSAAPSIPFVDAQPLSELVDRQIYPYQRGAALLGVFGALATLLTMVGLLAFVAFTVRQRTSEIGIRLALGATPGAVARMVTREALGPTALGVAVGGLCAIGVGRLLGSLLFGVTANEVSMLAPMGLALLGVSAVASYVPARRAARLDPTLALRAE